MTRPPGMPDWIPDSCIIDGAGLKSDDPEVRGEALKRVADAIVKKIERPRVAALEADVRYWKKAFLAALAERKETE